MIRELTGLLLEEKVYVETFICNHGFIKQLCFLQFVDEKVQWLHIDMAGPVWNEKQRCATGFGVATLVEWVLKNAS